MTVSPAASSATRTAFFIPGFVVASWAPLVPWAKTRVGLDDAQLGLLLLCLGLGSLAAMPLSGAIAARRGCRTVMVGATVAMALVLPLLSVVSSVPTLALSLVALGAAVGAMDCVMNLQAIAVERESGRSMMSGFHAFYSVGSLAGALLATSILAAGASPVVSAGAASASALSLLAFANRHWRGDPLSPDGPLFAVPRGIVAWIGVVCFVFFLAEGAMLDWSAVFLHEVRGFELAQAGWGFVVFNVAMTATRFVGDRVIDRLGHATAVLAGGCIAAAGLAIATLVSEPWILLGGYALVGIGCANVVPAMFTCAGRQSRMPASVAIPAVTTLAYTGVLAGPALVGLAAHHWSLSTAFLLVTSALLLAAGIGSRLGSR